MLNAPITTQLQAYLGKVTSPVEITASLDDSDKSREMRALLQDIAALSDKLTLIERHDSNERTPSFALNRLGSEAGVRFAGIPMGHEFTSLVLALLQVGGHPPKVEADVLEQIANLKGDYVFETYISLSCQNCPEVVQALNLMAVINPNIRHVMIDAVSEAGRGYRSSFEVFRCLSVILRRSRRNVRRTKKTVSHARGGFFQ